MSKEAASIMNVSLESPEIFLRRGRTEIAVLESEPRAPLAWSSRDAAPNKAPIEGDSRAASRASSRWGPEAS